MTSETLAFLEAPLVIPEHVPGSCERCGSLDDVKPTCSRTAYEQPVRTWWDVILDQPPEDPNRDIQLCPDCTLDHHSYWDDMWAQVYADRL